MMTEASALRVALDLKHVPSRVHVARKAPLPRGMDVLLQIAAGEGGVAASAAEAMDRDLGVVREAAAFFIEQILLAPGADSYRVLGTTSEATPQELRRHMALMMKWLHPDAGDPTGRSAFAARVTSAWEDLKTPQRRQAYDRAQYTAQQTVLLRQRRGRRRVGTATAGQPVRSQTMHLVVPERPSPGLVARFILSLLGRGRR